MSVEPFIYSEWFDPVSISPLNPITQYAEDYLHGRHIKNHPFFQSARHSADALKLWTSQELVITNEFAKHLHSLAGQINNTHLRAMVDVVIAGENGPVSPDGVARVSHPTLLNALRESLGIAPTSVKPLPETIDFLAVLGEACKHPLRGVAAIGVGNEKMILDEYAAIMDCFGDCLPDANFKAFLLANISEDSQHADLLAKVGTGLINQGHNPVDYYIGTKQAVDARFTYYDRLLERI